MLFRPFVSHQLMRCRPRVNFSTEARSLVGQIPVTRVKGMPMCIHVEEQFMLPATHPNTNVVTIGDFYNGQMGKPGPWVNFSDLTHDEYSEFVGASFRVQSEAKPVDGDKLDVKSGTLVCIEGGHKDGHAYFATAYHCVFPFFKYLTPRVPVACSPKDADFVTEQTKILRAQRTLSNAEIVSFDEDRDVALIRTAERVEAPLKSVKIAPWDKATPPDFVFCCGYRVKTSFAEEDSALRPKVISVSELDKKFGASTDVLSVSCLSKRFLADVHESLLPSATKTFWADKSELVAYHDVSSPYGNLIEEVEYFNSGLPGYSGGGLFVTAGEVRAIMTREVKQNGNYASPILQDDPIFGDFF